MARLITPIIFIGIAIAVLFMFTNPIYSDIKTIRDQLVAYEEALGNSKALENERDKLTAKQNAINPENLKRLQKMLPENVDNIRLILEIDQIASPYGMSLKDVKYNTADANAAAAALPKKGSKQAAVQKNYGVFELEFSTSATYDNFIKFTKDLENNLRIVDISSVIFSSGTGTAGANLKLGPSEVYKYNFKIKTYWLKD